MFRLVVIEVSPWQEGGMHRRECLPIECGSSMAQLRALVGTTFGKHIDNVQLIYLGKILEDTESLEEAGLNAGSIVLLYPKHEFINPLPSTENDRQRNKDKILTCVKELLKKRALHAIEKTDVQMHVLRSMPHLECSTMALLQSERLLKKWVQEKDHKTLNKLAQEHPFLGDALEKALQCLLSQGVPVIPKQSGNAYSVDALSDGSEDEADMQGFHYHVPSRPGGSRPQLSGMRSPGQQPQRGAITNEMLQAALQAAYSEQTQVAARAFGPQLAAMREMGLTDERACVQALVRTGGDVDMAVDLLLSE
ncbi:hypothetical protein BIW11_14267 [Tropilaelaps mercedesae]|uniref:Ubiquitin-like protein 7 n=1 Tax=Tropilaelaps mercedesae TaxID=418985 RepID=A0A1V9WYF0_9ACAR|nr:hypothetical protein BIW11_14267 [Tropilaelaps mercedesae]